MELVIWCMKLTAHFHYIHFDDVCLSNLYFPGIGNFTFPGTKGDGGHVCSR
jgi:hypothetical protein